jgi:hypothetical protein
MPGGEEELIGCFLVIDTIKESDTSNRIIGSTGFVFLVTTYNILQNERMNFF